MILGGASHENAFFSALRRCKQRLVIHSTFISKSSSDKIFPKLLNATQRGAKVDILWGHNENHSEINSSRRTAVDIINRVKDVGFEKEIRVHSFSSESHSKILFYDLGKPNSFEAIFGSCNWLYPNFQSFEAPLKIRDKELLSDITLQLSEIARPNDNQIPEFVSEIIHLGFKIKSTPNISTTNGSARIIFGEDHQNMILEARDNAKERFVIISNKLGVMFKPIVTALSASAGARGFSPEVYYSTTSGPVNAKDAAEAKREVKSKGVDLTLVQNLGCIVRF